MGQRAVRAEVFAERVMPLASARMPMRFSSLGAGRMVRESDMGNLDHLPDFLGRQLAAPFHRKLGRTSRQGQVQGPERLHCSAFAQEDGLQPKNGLWGRWSETSG